MAIINSQPLPSRPAPVNNSGLIFWLRSNFFSSPLNTVLTAVCLYGLWQVLPGLVDWFFLSATWAIYGPEGNASEITNQTVAACKEAGGACWSLISVKHRFMLFGFYPQDEQWRPMVTCFLLVGMMMASGIRRFWHPVFLLVWLATLVVSFVLMAGGLFGLTEVPTSKWGGLPLTLGMAVLSVAFSLPFGILLALGRRSEMNFIRTLCICYIELIRAVPLISILFMASFLLPLFMPEDLTINKLLRAQIGIILFASAYMAEVIRGGLQAIPKGQYEAADAMGLTYWQATRKIILPQALKISIPPIVSTIIGTFKDSSLVVIIGLFDVLNTVRIAFSADPPWTPFYMESYFVGAAVFFIFCFGMSHYSQWLEKQLDTGHKA
ncbi:amino acid ABC transporter permease [Parendozoicomonas haliclonae]|uniref:Inner membrane amino-acid ABC transporter permease protein YhdY n=1 Tax=Parendozoicomonas haliclonae TaxID=1960125 RepID=A0A1X7AJE2_9GAMM|nr:amino acid ABC transporter permease [Parendozoicomonas haliclonae]SMA46363.1 Inner membrane amino-acid ABC transporter permease protein YhdY [Parendozoicomonas haliclonae]